MKTRNENPGPGTYRLPSDFGYLELKKWHISGPESRNAANSSMEVVRRKKFTNTNTGIGAPYAAEMNRFMHRRKSS